MLNSNTEKAYVSVMDDEIHLNIFELFISCKSSDFIIKTFNARG